MVAINFKERFADDVESGRKKQTIRQKARCEPGDKLQLYTGQRTAQCRKLLDAECTSVRKITITQMGIWLDGEQLPCGFARRDDTEDCDGDFARKDGFQDFCEMADFFHEQYGGLPFHGFLIQWK